MRGQEVLLVGPIGGHNAGDELIAHALIDVYRNNGLIPSYGYGGMDPDDGRQRHGIPCYRMEDLERGIPSPLFDCVVIAGGEQFQEARLGLPDRGLLSNAVRAAAYARRSGVPLFIHDVGMERIRYPWSRVALRKVLRQAEFSVLRDPQSARSAQLLVRDSRAEESIVAGADPVFRLADRAREGSSIEPRVPHILVAPAVSRETRLSDAVQLVQQCQAWAEARGLPCSVLLMDGRPRCEGALEDVALPGPRYRATDMSFADLLGLVSSASVIVGARMHALICGVSLRRPIVNVARGSKMSEFARHFPMFGTIAARDPDRTRLDECLQKALGGWSEEAEAALRRVLVRGETADARMLAALSLEGRQV